MNDPDFWRCRACGCLWRDNHDGSVSLGSVKQTSCALCEDKTDQECEPLYRLAASRVPDQGWQAKWSARDLEAYQAKARTWLVQRQAEGIGPFTDSDVEFLALCFGEFAAFLAKLPAPPSEPK